MIVLEDYQFEYEGVAFGLGLPVAVTGDGFDPGVDEFTSQDVANAFNDSYSMGRDSRLPALWTWEAHTDQALSASEALAASQELGSAWDNVTLRRTPGAVAPLRYCVAGRTRVVFGRGRPFGQAMTQAVVAGMIPMSLEFQRQDALFYDDVIQSFEVRAQPSIVPGFTTPIVSPLTTIEGTPTTDSLPGFGGDAAAPFEATFTGPATNPRLYTDDWEIGVMTTIAAGRSITVSTYPWGVRAVRDDGVRLPGVLSIQTRLSKARLSPLGEQVRFSAIDSTNTANVTLNWRPAFKTL